MSKADPTNSMKYLNAICFFAAYISASCLGLYQIKAATEWKSFQFFSGVGLYGIGAVLWLVILRFMPLSFSFPIAAGGLIVCTLLIGRIFLHEELSTFQLIGAAFIVAGIFFTAVQ